MKRKLGDINVSLAKRIMQEAYEMGVCEVGFYTTGEMFLCRDIVTHISNSKKIGFKYIYSDTNGALASQEKLEAVIKAGIDSIKFSINAGTSTTYKKVHGRDDFEKVIENLKICYDLKQKLNRNLKIMVSYVLINLNEKEVEMLKKQVNKYIDQFYVFSFWNHHPLRYNCDMSSLNPSVMGLRDFPMPCNNLKRVIVNKEGFLTACCLDFNNDLILADLNKTSLMDAWNSENALSLRRAHRENKLEGTLCNTCAKGKFQSYEPLKL
jgi:MoaA/NifB/PqqE/SkfB family radical SAM enzyme